MFSTDKFYKNQVLTLKYSYLFYLTFLLCVLFVTLIIYVFSLKNILIPYSYLEIYQCAASQGIVMIRKLLLSLSLVILIALPASAYTPASGHGNGKEHVIDLKKEPAIGNITDVVSLHGSIYMAGQPDEATLNDLKNMGFDVVLNIRADGEIPFDEQAIVEGHGLAYYNIPLLKDGHIQDASVTALHKAIEENKDKKILFHCGSGNRVASWLGAHLARDMNYETETAVSYAKQAGMTKAAMEKILRAYITSLKE